ncbi:MAG TPA: hypothetical protein VGG32_11175 [Thermoplasmata archaeon]|jgi:hypothetical protein
MTDPETSFLLATCEGCGCGRPNHWGYIGPCRNCFLCNGFSPLTDEDRKRAEEIVERNFRATFDRLRKRIPGLRLGTRIS